MLVGSRSRLVTNMRTRSPSTTSMVGPGLTVVAPQIGFHPGRDLANHGLRHQMEFLDPVAQAPGQAPAIQGGHGMIGPAVRRYPGFLRRGRLVRNQLRQRRQCALADRARRHRKACAAEESSSGNHVGSSLFQGEALPISAVSRSDLAIQKSRALWIAASTLAIWLRASANKSKMLMSDAL